MIVGNATAELDLQVLDLAIGQRYGVLVQRPDSTSASYYVRATTRTHQKYEGRALLTYGRMDEHVRFLLPSRVCTTSTTRYELISLSKPLLIGRSGRRPLDRNRRLFEKQRHGSAVPIHSLPISSDGAA